MYKFVVCIDCDNTINNLCEQLLKMYNKKYSTSYSVEDINKYSLDEVFNPEIAARMHEMFLDKSLWDSLTPLEDSQKAIKALINRGYDVYIATATDYRNFEWKVEWFASHFPFIDEKKIIRIHDKSLLHADVLIEDCYDNLLDNKVASRILLDCPWNQSTKDDIYGINRAYNWKDIVRFVDNIFNGEQEWLS